MNPNVRIIPQKTTNTGRRVYLTWEKRSMTATTISTIASEIRVRMLLPISSLIPALNAGEPDTDTVMPAGVPEKSMNFWILSTISTCVSELKPLSNGMLTIAIVFDGSSCDIVSEGIFARISLISPLLVGRTPPLAAFRASAKLVAPRTYR